MDTISEAREHLVALRDLLDDIEAKSEKIDPEVSRQKSRPFKTLCYLWFGHLPDNKTGICKRCGKKLSKS